MNGPAAAWLAAVADPGIAASLESVYTDIRAEVDRRAPACWASGRCCNFEQAGHRLYVTGLEAAYTVSGLAAPPPSPGPLPLLVSRPPALTAASLAGALAAGSCPFLVGHLCGAHAVRPLGCRVYFCDRSAQDWQMDLSERMLRRVRALHDERGLEYRYGEWRAMLGLFVPR
jgi:Fe-S-cluster containining protein